MARFSQPHFGIEQEPKGGEPRGRAQTDVLLLGRGVADGLNVRIAPTGWYGVLIHCDGAAPGPLSGILSVRSPIIAAVGLEADLTPHLRGCPVIRQEYPDHLIIPGLVNAHAHLDLTHIGPQPASQSGPGKFAAFARLVRDRRAVEPDAIRDSVRRGVEMSLAGGVVAVGDIAGAVRGAADIVAAEELARSPLWGTAFLEFFSIGAGEERGRTGLKRALQAVRAPGIQIGIQPHAPYSVSAASYDWAMQEAATPEPELPLCSHVAESPEEHELIEKGIGPLRQMLEELGIWTEGGGGTELLGKGQTPVAHVLDATDDVRAAMTLVHCNDLSDSDVFAFRQNWNDRPVRVVYCPRSSAYFDAPKHFGPHRYRDLHAAGIVVALGTDSIINLEAGTAQITPWHEARILIERDGLQPWMALAMMTSAAALAIGIDNDSFMFKPGTKPYGIAAVPLPAGTGDPLRRAILESVPRTILLSRKT